jgi:demethylmenaquinone methyltransferase/2-methoxy-6-polyprenyl-1,4-benzoquinol methylase
LDSYNKTAYSYDILNRLYFLTKDNKYRSALAESIVDKPQGNTLVLCCGTGLDFPALLKKNEEQGTLVGVDISSEMLKQAKKKSFNKVDLVMADAEHLPFKERTFSSILVSFCLKITPSVGEVIEEASSMLKPNGKLGILANNKPKGFWRIYSTIIVKLVGKMAKIDYKLDIRKYLSKSFKIIEDKKLYWSLVRFVIAKKKQKI